MAQTSIHTRAVYPQGLEVECSGQNLHWIAVLVNLPFCMLGNLLCFFVICFFFSKSNFS